MNGIIGAYCASDKQVKYILEYGQGHPCRVYHNDKCIIKMFYPPEMESKCHIEQDIRPGEDMVVFGDIYPDGQIGTPLQWIDDSKLRTFDGEFIRIVVSEMSRGGGEYNY